MQTINIISNELEDILPIHFNKIIKYPEDRDTLGKFDLETIENNSIYYIESIADKNNSLNYDGVKVALRIYFNHLNKNFLKFKIVLFGFEDKASFFEDCDYSLFLKCPGVEYIQITLTNQDIEQIENIKDIEKKESISALQNIGIKPPTSYKTHHSITNEWAIYRWSKYLGFNSPIDDEIDKSLYFNYLKTIYEIPKVQIEPDFPELKGNLLIIDDEINKGWGFFFSKFKLSEDRAKKGKKFDVNYLGKDFKEAKDKNEIIKIVKDKIIDFNPDTIILDLRLHDSDFEEKDIQQFSGFKILESIKEMNPGIQVIIFSATNKITNFTELMKVGIDGWITKESPELSKNKNITKELVQELKQQIITCLEKKYLKNLYFQKQKLIQKIQGSNHTNNNFKEALVKQLNISFSLLSEAKKEEEFAYAYISLYMIIEILNDEFYRKVEGEKWQIYNKDNLLLKNWEWDKESKEYTDFRGVFSGNKPPEWKKIAGLYFQLWNKDEQEFITKIYHCINKRNWFLHNDIDNLNHKNKHDKYPNHDIYTHEGFENLFKIIKQLIFYL